MQSLTKPSLPFCHGIAVPCCFVGAAFLLTCAASDSNGQENTWTDKSGRFTVEASFEGLENSQVKLKRLDNGKVVLVPIERLSTKDQAKARKLQAEKNPSKSDSSSAPKKSSTEIDDKLKLSAEARWSKFIELDQDNKPKPSNIDLVITAEGPAAKNAIEFGFSQLTEAIDDNGTKLKTKKPLSDFFDKSKKYEKIQDRGTDFFAKHPVDGVKCTFELLRSSGIKSLKSVKGSFKIKTGGERETIKIDKVISNIGPVESASLKKAGIKANIKRPNPNSLEIKLEGTDLSAAYRVAVLNPEGKKLKAQNGSSWGGYDKAMTYSFSFEPSIPGDATVYIYLATGTVEKEIPFEFKDLKLPKEKKFGF